MIEYPRLNSTEHIVNANFDTLFFTFKFSWQASQRKLVARGLCECLSVLCIYVHE